jgi:hypothetical protein
MFTQLKQGYFHNKVFQYEHPDNPNQQLFTKNLTMDNLMKDVKAIPRLLGTKEDFVFNTTFINEIVRRLRDENLL